jgi:hypothetical protein
LGRWKLELIESVNPNWQDDKKLGGLPDPGLLLFF